MSMILVTRRFIILLLLVLQGFAPLVHAHVHMSDSGEGIHIHGIVSVASDGAQLSALDNFSCSDTAIGMHSAIQKKKTLPTDVNVETVCPDYIGLIRASAFIAKVIGFSPPGISLKPSLLLPASAPRAPPL